PGEPQLVAVKIGRDLFNHTFTFETSKHATLAFAQNWLIKHGCPPERTMPEGDFPLPADELTRRVEEQVRTSGERYQVLGTHTSDSDPCETWTLVRDPRPTQAPIRVFLEEGDLEEGTYTVREGAFADTEAASTWLDDRSGPMPDPPEYRDSAEGLRARAALARSSTTSAKTTPAAATERAPAPVWTQLQFNR
ncbi:glycosyl hydrolase, partial [Kitasatospora nipponensis]|uniref:glycosyl hydrolase n=1 Tax=Kitasatospora nipponensis TaxID=258049 RepID=UPI0031DCB248